MSKLERIILIKRLNYILYCILMLLVAYLFDRFFQMLIFILFFSFIQNCFHYRFHADTLFENARIASFVCKLITIGVETIYLVVCKDLYVSVYSNLFVIFIISLINALLQFYFEFSICRKSSLKSKEYIISMGQQAGLTDTAINRLIMRYVEGKSIQEIASIEYVEIESIKQSLRRSRRKLNM